jgi:hypothetical protein
MPRIYPERPISVRPRPVKPQVVYYAETPTSLGGISDRMLVVIIAILGFVGGALTSGYKLASSVVTQEQFNKTVEEMKKYTDARSQSGLETAEKYSDANRLQTLNDMKSAQATLQSKVDSVAVKQDFMLDTVKQLQQQLSEGRRK